MKAAINFVEFENRVVSAKYLNLMLRAKVVLVDKTSGEQLPNPVITISLPAPNGSLRIRLPDTIKPGTYYLKALNGRRVLAAPVERLQIICAGLDGIRQPDPQRTVGGRRRDRDDRIGQLLPAGLVDKHDLRPEHQVQVLCRNDAIFKFHEINGSLHDKTVRCRLAFVNQKLRSGFLRYFA